jgi:ATP-dependent DNA helicase RecG
MTSPIDSVLVLKGIGPKKAEALGRLNIRTIQDFLFHFPRQYQDRRKITAVAALENDIPALIRVKILKITGGEYFYGKKKPLRIVGEDLSGIITIFYFQAQYYRNAFKEGETYYYYGKPKLDGEKWLMFHPDYTSCQEQESRDTKGEGIRPIYPLTAGISQLEMIGYQRQVRTYLPLIRDHLPEEIRKRNRLCSLSYALEHIHFPENEIKLKEARFRLVFDELFLLQTGLLLRGAGHRQYPKLHNYGKNLSVEPLLKRLPFQLTGAQRRVWAEIQESMEESLPMNRLVQGDVGSGKTILAALALYKASQSGFQGVMMAPTELLAQQHYNTLKSLLEPLGVSIRLLTSSLPQREKKEIVEEVKSGICSVLIGTHAVIQPSVLFRNLTLVITDEQHRFGVDQRIRLMEKGYRPDTLVMTATPIPRTLAAILYGDLNISVLDERPPGRQKILTEKIKTEDEREKMYLQIRTLLEQGQQCYVVTPLIEDSEQLEEVRSAEEVYKELTTFLAPHTCALLHGNMKGEEKNRIMTLFKEGLVKVLISTVVIEVGIHVENATVMVIENAERFGLAQLHQLRGRVGRGTHCSYCYLVSYHNQDYAMERLNVLTSSQDGFYIAEKDLELRGPGEAFGTKQHGVPDLMIADLSKHLSILDIVKTESNTLLEADPQLANHPLLANQIEKMLERVSR